MFCPICHKAANRIGLCDKCHNRLHLQLDDILEFWHSAHGELLPGRSGDGGRSPERTIGLNVNALSFIAGDDILGMLHEWEKVIREDRDLTRPAMLPKLPLDEEIETAVKFAQRHLTWSGTQGWISDFAHELHEIHSKGKTAAKAFTKRSRKIACPGETADGLSCGNMLKALDDPMEIFECRKCKSQWTTLRLVAVALSDPSKEVWLDAEAIASYVKTTVKNVHQFAKRHEVGKRGDFYDFKQFIVARNGGLDKS